MLRFTLDGEKHEFDPRKLMNTEAMALKRMTEEHLTVEQWMDALGEVDAEALTFLVWVAKKRSGEPVKFSEIEFDLLELAASLESDEDSEESPDPTESTTKPDPT